MKDPLFKQDNKSLAGKVVVITGASSGIGRATAYEFARQGARLVLAARRKEVLEEVAADCEQMGAEAIAVPTDVTQDRALFRLTQAAKTFGGRIDVWVNNAGAGALGEFDKTPLEAHDQVIKINLIGYLHGAHAVLPCFKDQGSGVLINTVSLGAYAPMPYGVSYTASKFGLRGFSEALRAELSSYPNIHVCDVYPAFIDTPGFQHGGNYIGKEIKPAPPVYAPEKVAKAIVSLAKHPQKGKMVGSAAYVARFFHFILPQLTGKASARLMEKYFEQAEEVPVSDANLFESSVDGIGVSGGWRKPSPGNTTPYTGAVLAAGAAVGLLYWLKSRQ